MQSIKEVNNIEKRRQNCSYIKLSIFFFVLTIASFLYLFSFIPSRIGADDPGFPEVPKWIIIVYEASCLSGVIFSMTSIIKKEKPSWLKIVVATLNLLLFIFVAGIVVFAFHNR